MSEIPHRRRFQFSLRTLFGVVTLLAILCGAAAWVIQDRQRLIRERDEARQREAKAIRQQEAMEVESTLLIDRLRELKKQLRDQPSYP